MSDQQPQEPAQTPPEGAAQQPVQPPVQQNLDLPENTSAAEMFNAAAQQAATQQVGSQQTAAPQTPLPNPTSDDGAGSAAAVPVRGDQTPQAPADSNQQQPPSPQPTLSQEESAYLQAMGIDPSSQQQAISGLLSRIREMTPYAQAGMEQFSQAPAPEQTSQPAQPQEPEGFDAEKYFAEKWQVPEYQPEFDHAIQKGLVEQDPATGVFKPVAGYETMVAPIIQGLNEYHQRRTAMMQDLFSGNPFQKFHEVLQEPIKQSLMSEVDQLVAKKFQEVDDRRYFEDFRSRNADWLYDTDANGKQVESAAGKVFLDNAEMLIRQGVPDRQAFEIAERQRQAYAAAGQPQPPAQQPAPQQPAAQTANPQQPAPAQPAAPQATHPQLAAAAAQQPPQQQSSFLESAMNRVAHSPSAAAGSAPSDPLDDVPIDSIFTQAAHAMSANTPQPAS